jgi:hypothetical protein
MCEVLHTSLVCPKNAWARKVTRLGTHVQSSPLSRRYGNPHGNRHRTRHLLNQEFLQALLLNFRHQGKKAIEKVARNQPAVYARILTQLVPHELQIEHANRIKQMTDEELEGRSGAASRHDRRQTRRGECQVSRGGGGARGALGSIA